MADGHSHDSSDFERKRLTASLAAQPRLCERLAAECWDEDAAQKLCNMAKECSDAAKSNEAGGDTSKLVTPAVWPLRSY